MKRMLALFTMLPMDEVERLGSLEPPMLNRAKEILAYEATAFVHGHEKAIKAYKTAGNTFGFADPNNEIETSSMIWNDIGINAEDKTPKFELKKNEIADIIQLCRIMALSGMCKSSSEARRLIRQGGCYVNGEKVLDETKAVSEGDFPFVLQVGKKNRKRICLY